MYGLKTWGKDKRKRTEFVRKRTKFMTNCPELAEELGRRCNNQHTHQQLINGRAKDASKYPEELCQAICRGLMKAMTAQAMNVRHLMAVSKRDAVGLDTKKEKGVSHVEDEAVNDQAFDDVTGDVLDPKEVMKARLNELEYI